MRNVGKKILKSTVAIVLATIMMVGFVSVSNAEEVTRGIVSKEAATNHNFNKKDILVWSALVGAGNTGGSSSDREWPFLSTVITQEGIDSGRFVELNLDDVANDNLFNANDAAKFAGMRSNGRDGYKIAEQLAQKFNLEAKDVEVEITVALPRANDKIIWNIKNGTLQQNEELANIYMDKMYEYDRNCYVDNVYSFYEEYSGTQEQWEEKYNSKVLLAQNNGENNPEKYAKKALVDDVDCTVVSARGILPDGTAYRLIVGANDNWELNVLLEKEIPTMNHTTEFATEISYIAADSDEQTHEGKMDGNTFLPPYYDNDNAKKDMDAIAIIKSKTEEGIVKINGVDLNKDEETPNSLGWYYPDTANTKIIAKKYLFDKYDNIEANGMVSETVKLTGENGGEDTQNPSIKWTFRRTKKDEATNSDESITVTITYNLPIDTTKIPDGWEAVYDEGSTTTAHKIRKTIKKGENYEKDVIVKQNGTDATVTTHVAKVWAIPQAGESIAFVIAIAIIGFVVITRARKHHNLKDIK